VPVELIVSSPVEKPVFMVVRIALVDVSITVTGPLSTYKRLSLGFNTIPAAFVSDIVVTTVLVVGSITDTAFPGALETYKRVPFLFIAIFHGPGATVIF